MPSDDLDRRVEMWTCEHCGQEFPALGPVAPAVRYAVCQRCLVAEASALRRLFAQAERERDRQRRNLATTDPSAKVTPTGNVAEPFRKDAK